MSLFSILAPLKLFFQHNLKVDYDHINDLFLIGFDRGWYRVLMYKNNAESERANRYFFKL